MKNTKYICLEFSLSVLIMFCVQICLAPCAAQILSGIAHDVFIPLNPSGIWARPWVCEIDTTVGMSTSQGSVNHSEANAKESSIKSFRFDEVNCTAGKSLALKD